MLRIEVNNVRAEVHSDGDALSIIAEAMIAIRSMYDVIKEYGDKYGEVFKKTIKNMQDGALFADKYKGVEISSDTTEDDLPFC